ncbi:MAG: response regulator [Deltaproteobacteria bacterium]|nr:response regulator [Deltaproteobacteria bacterium]
MADRDDDPANEQRSQRMEAIGQLAGGIAHDFNNLLTVITTCASFLREGLPAESSLQVDVEDIRLAAERAAALTRQLLAFSRRQMLAASTLDVEEVVEALLPSLRKAAGDRIDVQVDAGASPGHVIADRAQVEQVVTNLVANARDALPTGGRIRIVLRRIEVDAAEAARHEVVPGHHVAIAVVDDGLGMEEGVAERVFEPFFTTKDVGRRRGLGLSTVYGIVRQSGGYVTVDSRLGLGSTFEVVFPAAPEEALEAERPITEAPSSYIRGGRVLLVEDEDALRAATRRVLQREGYVVVDACDGRDALAAVDADGGRFDLVVTDVEMPMLGGRELYDALVARQPDLRVLYMSGYTDDEVVRRGVHDGSAPFLAKPFMAEDLVLAVEDALSGRSPSKMAHGIPAVSQIHLK